MFSLIFLFWVISYEKIPDKFAYKGNAYKAYTHIIRTLRMFYAKKKQNPQAI